MPGKKRNYRQILLCTVVFMTAKLTALFSLPCLRRPVDCGPHRAVKARRSPFLQVSGRFGDGFRRFLRTTEKGLPIRPKKTSRISAARNSFLRAAARIYMTPCEGSCCRSGRQLSATLCATASQYLAAVRGGHALAEAVLLGALTLLRLERSLHNFVHLPVLNFTDGHRHRSGARRGHMPLPVRII